jgi:hypothetical protein
MTKKYGNEYLYTIAHDSLVRIIFAGVEIKPELHEAILESLIPYLDDQIQNVALSAWEEGHMAGIIDYGTTSNARELTQFGAGSTPNPYQKAEAAKLAVKDFLEADTL